MLRDIALCKSNVNIDQYVVCCVTAQTHCASVYMVRHFTVTNLLSQLKQNGIRAPDVTRTLSQFSSCLLLCVVVHAKKSNAVRDDLVASVLTYRIFWTGRLLHLPTTEAI